LIEKKQYVYRMVDYRCNVLYVGQHRGIHPAVRVNQHKDKPWWSEVAGWDYEEIRGNLNAAEQDLINFWGGYYNKESQVFRNRVEEMSTSELLFEAGLSAGEYRHDSECRHAGRLKLIRAILWRRDETVVPLGICWSETPRDFSRDWDFADFPVLSPSGFVRTMGCFQPAGFEVGHPECGFEIDHHPLAILDYRAEWEKSLENAAMEGRKISYTSVHPPMERSARRPAA
jgi:hypothetical protein